MRLRLTPKVVLNCSLLIGVLGVIAIPNVASAAVVTPAAPTIAVGENHTCAVISGNFVSCWGHNNAGQLGDGTSVTRDSPVTVLNMNSAVSIGAGNAHTCVVTLTGSVQCWGGNGSGQLGNGSVTPSQIPVSVDGLAGAKMVTGGSSHSCALLGSGQIRCWGSNTNGQLGDGTNINRSVSVAVVGISNAVWISTGSGYSCAVLTTGYVKCWGVNGSAQLGNGSKTNTSTPTLVSILTDAVQVSSKGPHSCALSAAGLVSCWGNNSSFQGGVVSPSTLIEPVSVDALVDVASIGLGDAHSCARLSSGIAKCWGDNFYGKLGDGSNGNSSSPLDVFSLVQTDSIVGGENHTCARLKDDTVRCWGSNSLGQVGDGTRIDRFTPVTTLGFTTIAGGFSGITPFRIMDTRAFNGGYCLNGVRALQVAGITGSGVPTNAAAVALNVTVAAPRSDGFLTVYPSDTALPLASNLNFSTGQVVANNVIVKVGIDGRVNLYANSGCPDVVVDLVGSFSSGTPSAGGLTGITPIRIGDTRSDGGAGCVSGPRTFQVTGATTGIPGNAVAAALNITVVDPIGSGYLTVYPEGIARPGVSSLNFGAGQVVPNGTLVKLGTGGQIRVFANNGCPHVVVDVVGWFVSGTPTLGGFVGITPARLLDTRSTPGASCLNLNVAQQVAGPGIAAPDVPANAGSVALNVTAIGGSVPGYITAFPAGIEAPTASTVNFKAREVVPNGALVKVGVFASDAFTTNGGCPHLVVDIVGYFVGG